MQFESPESIGQALIISSASREEAVRVGSQFAQAVLCLRGHDVPCGQCRSCRKAASDVHPDFIRVLRPVDKDGKQKKELNVSQIRELSLAAQLFPVESDRKVFLIEEADLMNLNAQNAALKLLEEPPASAVFLLCVTNPGMLLDTVRSRCRYISVGGEADEGSDEAKKLAASYLAAWAEGKPKALSLWINENELSRLNETIDFLEAMLLLCGEMLRGSRDAGVRSRAETVILIRRLSLCLDYARANVNPKHLFSLLLLGSEGNVLPG